MEQEFYTDTPEATEQIGERLATALLTRGDRTAFIALCGEMGVGKTAFTRGFARALGVFSVKSPTFTVVNEYRGGVLPIFHFDTYRIESEDDLLSIGFDDYLVREGYALCEWSENIREFLPDGHLTVTIGRTELENRRKISIKGDAYEGLGT